MRFCDDVDILKYEPVLFGELSIPSQVLASGTDGETDGTSFATAEADFVNSQVAAGGVIYLRSDNNVIDGPFEILSVESATELTISVLRPEGSCDAVAPQSVSDLFYRVSTFAPQINEASFRLMEYFGIGQAYPSGGVDLADILDITVLKEASVFAVISSVYATIAGEADNENHWKKSLYYKRAFEKARESCRLSIDSNSDGVAEATRFGGCGRLLRD